MKRLLSKCKMFPGETDSCSWSMEEEGREGGRKMIKIECWQQIEMTGENNHNDKLSTGSNSVHRTQNNCQMKIFMS